MITAYLKDTSSWHPILAHPVLQASLKWLDKYGKNADFGDHPLGKPNWYANVHAYSTLPESECCWENHKHTIDIQYLVHGCEGVRWTSVSQLKPPRRYNTALDRQEFEMPDELMSLIRMHPGIFAIFLPGDAHCPKIALEGSEVLRKVVVKIPALLLEEEG